MDLNKIVSGVFEKSKKENLSEQESFDLIEKWGKELQVRLQDADFEEVKKEVWQAVSTYRLSYDNNDETFTYLLLKPIKSVDDGSTVMSMIKIKESDMNKKRGMSKPKDDFDKLAAMFKAYCTDSDGKEIEVGFLSRIKDRDQMIISAVILGFFVQAIPSSRKSAE
jgi:hypothetical protein